MKDTFENRLSFALNYRNMKPIDLAEKTKISKALISGYMNGRYSAKQDKLSLIADALGVNEAWLMGFDVPMENNNALENISFASHKGINLEGFDKDDIEEIKAYVEMKRNFKNKKK